MEQVISGKTVRIVGRAYVRWEIVGFQAYDSLEFAIEDCLLNGWRYVVLLDGERVTLAPKS